MDNEWEIGFVLHFIAVSTRTEKTICTDPFHPRPTLEKLARFYVASADFTMPFEFPVDDEEYYYSTIHTATCLEITDDETPNRNAGTIC